MTHETKKTADVRSAEEPKVAVMVTDLGVLEALSAIKVEVLVQGTPLVFEGRRLRPCESKEVHLLLEAALPPIVASGEGRAAGPEAKPEEPRYDFSDPGFLRRQEENKRKARAVALWSAFPVFRSKWGTNTHSQRAEPKTSEEITAFIESLQVDEDVLDVLFRALTQRMVSAAEYVGFTFDSSSRPS